VRLKGLDQAALLISVKVTLDGCGARVAVRASLAIRGLPLFEVEHRSADGNRFVAIGKMGELYTSAGLQHRNRAIRGAKIDSEKDLLTP
jgi:hypothetical protein